MLAQTFSFPLEDGDNSDSEACYSPCPKIETVNPLKKLLMNMGDRNAQNIGQVYYTVPSFISFRVVLCNCFVFIVGTTGIAWHTREKASHN
jgi:hypothetical protein